jgi:hypothetical protein
MSFETTELLQILDLGSNWGVSCGPYVLEKTHGLTRRISGGFAVTDLLYPENEPVEVPSEKA